MEKNLRVIVSENIRKFRKAKGLTCKELSIMSGLGNAYISRLERKSMDITIDRLAIIAKALDVKVIELLE